jgi:crotonobetainyl-CoA:carnitine CoA-transferase CaiB-like acyl-CoA transferase
MTKSTNGPLDGIRVLELGHFIAAPYCTRLLGDLGAEVIKIEPPGGDPVRTWGAQIDGNSVWWSVHGRNKKSVVIDLKSSDARETILKLVAKCDVVVENFRPGYLNRIGLDDETLRSVRPDLVIAHVSGFGQTGPDRDRAAFGVIGEAIGGLRYLTNHAEGESDLPPVRVGISIGDTVAGIYAALGVVSELLRRTRNDAAEQGGTVDVALTDSVLSLMEGLLPEYGSLGHVRQPTGSRIPTAAPTNAYPCKDGKWVLIAANSEPLFQRLMDLIGLPDLAEDSRFAGNGNRVAHVETLDAAIAGWTRRHTAEDADRLCSDAGIPSTLVYTAKECAHSEQFRARGMVREIDDPIIGKTLHPGIVPHIPGGEGSIRWTGPAVGADTDDVLRELAGIGGEPPNDAARRRGGAATKSNHADSSQQRRAST